MPKAMPADLDAFEVISFDCYGTLIDWESGILAAMQPVLARHELVSNSSEVLRAYARAESAVEAGVYRPYREVLRRTFAAMAKDLGFAPQAGELETFVDALGSWPPFPDTVRSLRALARAGHRLAVISNIDEDLFEPSARALEVEFEFVITAASVGAYKPDPAVFEAALARMGLAPAGLLHVAHSRFHDLATARRLGIQTVHVERDAGRDGASATPELEPTGAAELEPERCVPDLASFVRALGLEPEERN